MGYETDIFSLPARDFEAAALSLFRYQVRRVPVYADFVRLLKRHPSDIRKIEEIPCLPLSLFKTQDVMVKGEKPEIIFTSSGTTGTRPSRHLIADLALYERSFTNAFTQFYGPPQEKAILALLPAYLERQSSALVYMVKSLIAQSAYPESGFYLYDHHALRARLEALEGRGIPTLLIGVAFALLDFVEHHPIKLQHTLVMETGGMKGRRKELIREALHNRLKAGFGVAHIHSEYGMAELLSQAYSKGKGLFQTPNWLRLLIRDATDPLSYMPPGKSGGINLIDLANQHSCAFLATQDLGVQHSEDQWEIQGRFDHSEVRGCNLMVATGPWDARPLP